MYRKIPYNKVCKIEGTIIEEKIKIYPVYPGLSAASAG
jgi:hypothetical protein